MWEISQLEAECLKGTAAVAMEQSAMLGNGGLLVYTTAGNEADASQAGSTERGRSPGGVTAFLRGSAATMVHFRCSEVRARAVCR